MTIRSSRRLILGRWPYHMIWRNRAAPSCVGQARASLNPAYSELNGGFGQVGNLNLRPEQNRGFDLGVEATLLDGRAVIDVTYFNERLKDEITWTGTPINGSNYYNQTGTSKREGLELSGRLEATDTMTWASAIPIWTRKTRCSRELRRPRHELGLQAGLEILDGKGHLAADLRYVADNWDNQYLRLLCHRETAGLLVGQCFGSYDLTDAVQLRARVTNLFDKDYTENLGLRDRRPYGLGRAGSKW